MRGPPLYLLRHLLQQTSADPRPLFARSRDIAERLELPAHSIGHHIGDLQRLNGATGLHIEKWSYARARTYRIERVGEPSPELAAILLRPQPTQQRRAR